MSVRNAERFLVPSLESLLAQDYVPFEIVVCDDGSTDRTLEILESYPSIHVVQQSQKGPAAGRNAAIRASRGQFLAGFDGDDLWPSDRLTRQATFLMEHPEIGCVLGRQEWINPPPGLGRDERFGDLDGVPIGSAMMRRGVIEAVGGFDETFRHSEDMDLLFRIREHGFGIEILPEVVLYRRSHGDQLTAQAPDTSPLLRSLRMKIERERASTDRGD